jgi:hypothetical protein
MMSYIDYFLLVIGNGCNLPLLSNDIERHCEVALHLLVEIGIVTQIIS